MEILKPTLTKPNEFQYETTEAIRLLGQIAAGEDLLEPIAAGDRWELAAEAYLALAKIDPAKHPLTKDQTAR